MGLKCPYCQFDIDVRHYNYHIFTLHSEEYKKELTREKTSQTEDTKKI